jgi:hypothetical protein
MTIIAGLVAALLAVALLARIFLTADAAALARGLRIAGPLVLGMAGMAALLLGRAAPGIVVVAVSFGWWALQAPSLRRKARPRLRQSTVRTAAIEMQLDHGDGQLEGLVLAGRHEQRVLGTLSLPELLELYEDLRSDAESRQLLEAYLDGRFPVWREHADADRHGGQGGAPGAGAMTEQEAYKVLGLEAGASAADIRKAHRRLIQRLDPGVGTASLLAARIDKAKAILLAKHG